MARDDAGTGLTGVEARRMAPDEIDRAYRAYAPRLRAVAPRPERVSRRAITLTPEHGTLAVRV